jgi:long-chain fatty acid transport protein
LALPDSRAFSCRGGGNGTEIVDVRALKRLSARTGFLAAWLGALQGGLGAPAALANNGLNFIGSGLESTAMGGADLGVARDPLALNTNPAGLAWQRSRAVEQHLAVAHEIDVGFRDSLNPDQTVTNKWAPLANAGATIPLTVLPTTLGAGVFVQGGAGGAFKNVATPFGTTDELAAKFGIAKLSLGGGVRLDDRLSLGATGSLYYSRLDQKIFPGTSAANPANPAQPFFGTQLRDATGLAGGARLGLQYRASDLLTIGATYVSKVDLPLASHRFTVNESALGLGQVTYSDTHLKGLAEPQQAGIGAGYRITQRLLLALDLSWLDWSDALKSSTLTAGSPSNPAAPPSLSTTAALNWRDQYVVALGAAFDLTPATVIWAGYNYGRNPIPSATLNPLMAAIGEHHFTGGLGWRMAPGWFVGAALELLVPNEAGSTNATLPLGSDVRASDGYIAVHAGLRVEF